MTDKENVWGIPPVSRRAVLGLGGATLLTMADKGWAAVGKTPGPRLQSLGYVVAPGDKLDVWSEWAPKVYGLQLSDRSAGTRVFRMDDHQYRLAIDQGARVATYGWEVTDGAALDALAARLEAGGVKVARGSRALASQRGVRDLVTFTDPAGNGVEIFHGPALATFQPARSMGGFRTGALGMGHAVLMVQPALFEKVTTFYRQLLGFRTSDFTTVKGTRVVEFMHINPREHSLAVIANPDNRNQLHHIMLETQFMDDVGHAYDIVLKDYQKSIVLTLGRHINDMMTSFYVRTPSDFLIECGWGGLLIDPERWQAAELTAGGSIWGHQLMKDGQPADASFLPPPAERALRAPLQVWGENFEANHRPREQTEVLLTEPLR
ncbi:VOC family protein [Burkholderia sp. MR1-5-21]